MLQKWRLTGLFSPKFFPLSYYIKTSIFFLGAKFFAAVKNMTNGFVVLYKETKVAARMLINQSSKSSYVSKSVLRTEIEFLRSNRESVKKMTGFFFLQLVPILGYVPIVVGLIYPRQVFSHHFWSEEQKLLFLGEEFEERRKYCVDLAKELNFNVLQSSKDYFFLLRSNLSSIPYDEIALRTISSAHLTALAGAVGVCSNKAVLLLSPNVLLRYWLLKRAKEIIEDDRYILNNMTSTDILIMVDNASLTLLEQIEFCRRRGFDCSSSLLSESPTLTSTATSFPPPTTVAASDYADVSEVPIPPNEVISPARLSMDICIRAWVDTAAYLVKERDPKEGANIIDHDKAAIILHLIALNAATK